MAILRLLEGISGIPAAAWDALDPSHDPFTSHAFLEGLERHGCLRPGWGWRPCHATLWEDSTLVAAVPGYLKDNSHGEFVFDHAWANAYAQHGLAYYPKWLLGVPYSPVTGPRLRAANPIARATLLEALPAAADGWSSIHVNFLHEAEAAIFDATWLARCDVQFHWRRDPAWQDFDGFLDALTHKRRKAIRQERRKVSEAGITFRVLDGPAAQGEPMAAMHRFYLRTFADKWNHAALTAGFFQHLCTAMPEAVVLVLAERAGTPIGGALCLRSADTLYGRYWGSEEEVPGLHFEACYYQGIDYCLRHGLDRFEPGAQGEHKVARGFLPVLTHSRHWIADTRFSGALARWCDAERAATLRYRDSVLSHSPYREPIATPHPGP